MYVDSMPPKMPQFDSDLKRCSCGRARRALRAWLLSGAHRPGLARLAAFNWLNPIGYSRHHCIHPHEAKLATEADFAELDQLAKNPKVIAWAR